MGVTQPKHDVQEGLRALGVTESKVIPQPVMKQGLTLGGRQRSSMSL